jgi:DNA-binding MarR family transcriptional regulator
MRKPIFRNRWYRAKPPILEIGILKSIVSLGQISKKKATEELDANYPDISDAMDSLKKRDFIRFSENKGSRRNPEKFYKITESGLKALLCVDNLYPQNFGK